MDDAAENDLVKMLRQVAVRGTVTLKTMGTTRTDKSASREVIDGKRSIAGAAVVKVYRLPGADVHHKAIVNAQARGRLALNDRSMPYGDQIGVRLLPNRNLIPAMQEFAQARKEHDEAHARFLEALPNVLAMADANRGDLDFDLPTEEEVRDGYSMNITFEEIPKGDYEGFDEALSSKLAEHTKNRVSVAFRAGQAEVLPRILEPVAVFAERMQAYTDRERRLMAGESEDKGKAGQFRNAVVENLRPVAEALRGFNLVDDPRMESLATRVAALAELDAGDLRTDPGVREKSRKEAQDLLESIKDWSG